MIDNESIANNEEEDSDYMSESGFLPSTVIISSAYFWRCKSDVN